MAIFNKEPRKVDVVVDPEGLAVVNEKIATLEALAERIETANAASERLLSELREATSKARATHQALRAATARGSRG